MNTAMDYGIADEQCPKCGMRGKAHDTSVRCLTALSRELIAEASGRRKFRTDRQHEHDRLKAIEALRSALAELMPY